MKRPHRNRLGLETLENRRLLAVTVSNTPSGDLLIAGDSAADSIIITENETGTQWEIGGIGTTVIPLVVDVDPVRGGLQILKPMNQDVFIGLEGGNDSLRMVKINQGAGANAVTFVGQTTIDMGSESDSVSLGRHPKELNIFPLPPGGPTDSDIISSAQQGSRANDFIGAVSIDLGGSDTLAVTADTDNSLHVTNTDFGRFGTQSVAAVSGHLQVEGAVGVDTVTIQFSNNFGGSFDINTHTGADDIEIGRRGDFPVTLGGNLNINSGDGADAITLWMALARGGITVNGGSGDDTIRLGSSFNTAAADRIGSSALGDIVVHGGDGNDMITVNQATTAGALHIPMDGGANILDVRNSSFSAASSVSGGSDFNYVNFSAVNSPLGLHIQTAGGNDIVNVPGSLVELGVTSIVTGAGDDTIKIGGGSRFDNLIIATGDGNDTVSFGDSANVEGNASVAEFFVDLGAGDDSVDSGDSTFGRAFVLGGTGANTRSGQAFGQENESDFLFFEGFGA